MVYVNNLMPCLRNRKWVGDFHAHLYADTLKELHVFAVSIGLERARFRRHPRLPYYGVTKEERVEAIQAHALIRTRRETVAFMEQRMRDG